ncbi:hypothetical protein JXL19_04330 [bacterium]|nr:hypothetical protein [bacterium]
MIEGESKEKKEELKLLFKKLGDVINDTLSHSDDVQEVLRQMRKWGLGVDLSMVIGLGLYCNTDLMQKDSGNGAIPNEEIRFELTTEDRAFLNELNLRLNIDNDNSPFEN